MSCSLRLIEAAGRTSEKTSELISLYRKAINSEDVELVQYILSIIYVESRFNREAVSHADARGLMQMTTDAVTDATAHCNLKSLSDISKLHDSYTNVRYGTCYVKKLLRDMDGDWVKTLIIYNGGYKQLTRYENGESIVNETANYVLLVQRALNTICRQTQGNK